MEHSVESLTEQLGDNEDSYSTFGFFPFLVKVRPKVERRWLPRSAILILFWSLLMNVCDSSAVAYTKNMKYYDMIQGIIASVFCLFLPLLGLLADIMLGKHRMALFCVFISLPPSGVLLADVLFESFSHSEAGSALLYFVLPVYLLSRKALAVILIIFGVDQLVGESSYQMSAFIW